MGMKIFTRAIQSCLVGMVCIGPSAASADILAAVARSANFFSSSTTDVAVPLRPNGSTSFKFTTTGPGKTLVKITFNSECTVAAPRGTWLTLRIEVDGVNADPASGTDYAFCTAIDASGNTWMSVTRQSLIRVQAGEHVVKVFASAVAPASWQLGDTSLVVEK
jgi:hypothetical protein